jgi:hypothetical protein
MKWLIILVALIIFLGVGWYLISPAFKDIEVNEESPLEIKDSMLSMTEKQKDEFDSAVEFMKDDVVIKDEEMESSVNLLAEGIFKERAHSASGRALLIDNNGKKVLRFEEFETINGPNLHIYLASSLSDDDFVDLGEIKATKGNVNYDIPDDVDLEKYDKVLVWCVPFKVLFSYAELK